MNYLRTRILGPLYRSASNIRKSIGRSSVEEIFTNSGDYWEHRYVSGGNSGTGSYGAPAKYKARYISNLLLTKDIYSVVEFGCGDGNQLTLIDYRNYLGLDISSSAIEICRHKFSHLKNYDFDVINNFRGGLFDLSISLDVLYHLVEDDVFHDYMRDLFISSSKYVLIYSSNFDTPGNNHVRHRKFTTWVSNNCSDFQLISFEENPFKNDGAKSNRQPVSSAHFYLFERK